MKNQEKFKFTIIKENKLGGPIEYNSNKKIPVKDIFELIRGQSQKKEKKPVQKSSPLMNETGGDDRRIVKIKKEDAGSKAQAPKGKKKNNGFDYGMAEGYMKILGDSMVVKLKESMESEPIESESKDEAEVGSDTYGYLGTPLSLLPNICKIEVNVGLLDKMMSIFGIERKVEGKELLFSGPNRRHNRYLRIQYMRIIKANGGSGNKKGELVGQDKREIKMEKLTRNQKKALKKRLRKFGCTSLQLLTRSKIFFMVLLNETLGKKEKGFHRDYTLGKIIHIMSAFEDITRKTGKQNVPLHRTGIPAGPKYRPLGVGPIEYRLYTRGLSKLIETYLLGSRSDNQHGYRMGKGTVTVGREILSKVIHAKNIFEFDMKGFFESVRLDSIGKKLKEIHVPKFIVIHLMTLCASEVENIPICDLEELSKETAWRNAWAKYESIHVNRKGGRSNGVPQGMGISAILSTLTLEALESVKEHGYKWILYADDGLIYGPGLGKVEDTMMSEIIKKAIKDTGASIAEDKSSWVKKSGEGLKSLKFVGLEYDPKKKYG